MDRVELAEALHSADVLRAIFETTPECIKIVARDGTILRANAAGARIMGVDHAEDVVGRSIFDFVAPEDRAMWQRNHLRVCDGARLRWEFDAISAAGEPRRMEGHGAPLTLPDGSVAHLAITRAVTERSYYEAKLREGEQRFRDLLEALPAAIYTTDAAGRLTFFNDAAVKLTGRVPVVGSDEWCVTWRLFHPDGTPMPHDQCPMAVALREDRIVRGIEAIAERPDGTRVPFMPFPTPLHDSSGRLIGAVNMLVDISHRKRAEEDLRRFSGELEERVEQRTRELAETLAELRRSERRFRLLVDGVTDYAICMLDPDGVVTNWNVGAQRIKGYAAADIVGRHFSTFYPEEDRRAGLPQRALAGARASGRFEGEGWRVRQDGSRFWANAVIDAIHDEEGELVGFAKVTRDLTERRQMEERLRQAQKMEAVGQLTGGIAHDFNNILTAVMANLDFIDAAAKTEPMRRHAAAALKAAERGARLTQQLLAFSRKQRLEPRVTDLNALIGDMSDMLVHSLGGTFRIELKLAPALWPALIDRNEIENAVLNLAINARDAMPKGGTLTIETANRRVGPLRGEADVEPGDYVVIAVTDTGSGMTPEVRDKAFEPFFTTKDVGRGSGLGLSQVYGVMRQSGGGAVISSMLGEGTTVRLYLPRARDGEQAVGTDDGARRADAVLPGAGSHVLLVDDDEDVRMVTAETLREGGCAVTAAASGATALELLESGAFDLLVSDLAMPGMDGARLAQIVASRWPGLPVLLITGRADNSALRDLDEASILRKPFRSADLNDRVGALLARGRATRKVIPLRREKR